MNRISFWTRLRDSLGGYASFKMLKYVFLPAYILCLIGAMQSAVSMNNRDTTRNTLVISHVVAPIDTELPENYQKLDRFARELTINSGVIDKLIDADNELRKTAWSMFVVSKEALTKTANARYDVIWTVLESRSRTAKIAGIEDEQYLLEIESDIAKLQEDRAIVTEIVKQHHDGWVKILTPIPLLMWLALFLITSALNYFRPRW